MNREDLRETAARLALARVVGDKVREYIADARGDMEPQLEPGEKIKAVMPDGTAIGNVQRTERSKVVKVNLHQLAPWVEKNRPDQMARTIQDGYLTYLMKLCKEHGHAFDERTGEVIPGIELVEGESSFRVTPNDNARAIVAQTFHEFLALPGGESGSDSGTDDVEQL